MNKLIVGIMAALLVAGCVAPSSFVCPDGTEVSDSSLCQQSSDNLEETVEEEYIVDDLYIEILNEELNSTTQEDFGQMEDNIASDLSQFYYE